jgi:hypothetical protein
MPLSAKRKLADPDAEQIPSVQNKRVYGTLLAGGILVQAETRRLHLRRPLAILQVAFFIEVEKRPCPTRGVPSSHFEAKVR